MSSRPRRRQPVVISQVEADATVAIGVEGIEGRCSQPSNMGALGQGSIERRGTRPCLLPFRRTQRRTFRACVGVEMSSS